MKPIQYDFFKNIKEIKQDVKEDMQNSWKNSIIVTALTKILPELITALLLFLHVCGMFYLKLYKNLKASQWGEDVRGLKKIFVSLRWTADKKILVVLILVVFVLGVLIPLKHGCQRYFVLSAKTQHADFGEIFGGYKKIFSVISIELKRSLLWLLSFIPLYIGLFALKSKGTFFYILITVFAILFILGIWRMYKTKVTHMIFVENPDMDIDDIFEKSSLLMKKRIFAYIKLNASYYPWYLLSILSLFVMSFKVATSNQSANAFFYLDLL